MHPDAEKWMSAAADVAQRALCKKAKCGAVIVAGETIIGEGYNAPPLDQERNRMCGLDFNGFGKPNYDRTCCVHAEWRAIMDALRRHPAETVGATLYFTRVDADGEQKVSGMPYCTECSRFALDAGLAGFALRHETGIKVYDTHDYDQLSRRYTSVPKATVEEAR